MRNTFLFTLLIVFVLSCSRPGDNNPTNPNHGITPFTATVVKRTAVMADISWTPSIDIYNGDTVRYKISLNGSLIHSGMLKTRDTLTGLSADIMYQGLVEAYTSDGDTASAPFVLNKIQEYIAFHSEDHFEAYDMASGIRLWSKYWGIFSHDDAGPVILGDTVIYSNNQVSAGNTLFANNLKTGQAIWSNVPAGGANSNIVSDTGPVYDNGKIYVSTLHGLECRDKNSGSLSWTYNDFYLISTPVVSATKVFVFTSSTPQPRFVALDKNTGAVSWSFNCAQTDIRPLVLSTTVVFGTINGDIYALNQSNGSIAWQKHFPGLNSIEPMISINNLIVAFVNQDGFYGLNPANGNTVWHQDLAWLSYPSITAGNSRVYIGDYGNNKLNCYNAATGALLWQSNLGTEYYMIYAKQKIYTTGRTSVITRNSLTGVIENTVPFSGLTHDIGRPSIRINDSSYYLLDHGNFK